MPTTLELPVIPSRGVEKSLVAIPLSPTAIEREALRRLLPPAELQVLEALTGQIEGRVLDPLLYGASAQELVPTFERLYPQFINYYHSATLVLAGALEGDPQRLSALASLGSAEAKRTLIELGPEKIGREPTNAALVGLETMVRVARRALQGLGQVDLAAADLAAQWVSTALAYMLSIGAVTHFLSRDEQLRGGATNAVWLSYWSKEYAVSVYDISKRVGMLKATPLTGPLPKASDEQDILFAEAGAESYLELLAEEENSGNAGTAG